MMHSVVLCSTVPLYFSFKMDILIQQPTNRFKNYQRVDLSQDTGQESMGNGSRQDIVIEGLQIL